MKMYVSDIRLNDEMPELKLEKREVRVVFQEIENDWHHTFEAIVFVEKNENATVAEVKEEAIKKAKELLRSIVSQLD